MRFTGKTVMITGAASGMGMVTSRLMAEEGALVYMLDINEKRLKEIAAEICEKGGKAFAQVCDVREYEQIEASVQRCVSEQGHLDIIIGYAGGFPARMCGLEDKAFIHTPVEVLDWGIAVNFRAPLLFARAAFEQMMKQRSGVIINIGSIDGETGNAIDYAGEKSGIAHGMTKALANQGAPYGIRCCAVTPGPVLTRPGMAGRPSALGRVAQPEEVAKLVMYLCSEDASFITGVNYIIDGGRLLMNNV